MIATMRPDIVFLDIGMPGMSGYEVAQAVRADPYLGEVRLVALTGWGGEADRAHSSAAGFDAHLTKPATVAAIEDVLARLAPQHSTAA
jgi:CheY-like chemotaxis protein